MTIKELYYFAINHSLLNDDIDKVIKEYNKTLNKSLDLNKIEYTFEDLMLLFS